jgi:hypothetical protein
LFPAAPDVVVSEFGFAEPFEGELNNLGSILWDLRRADYYRGFLDNILAAKVVDGMLFLLFNATFNCLSNSQIETSD